MARIRTNFVYGTVNNNPLAVDGTTLSSGGLADLAVVSSPDVSVIVIDPEETGGVPEIVYVTAHSSAATTATISRAQDGTTARVHSQGVPWVHGTAKSDWDTTAPSVVTARGDIVRASAAGAIERVALGTSGYVLKAGANDPEWAIDPTQDLVTTAGDILYGSAADTLTRLGLGTSGQVMTAGASAPSWADPEWVTLDEGSIAESTTLFDVTSLANYTAVRGWFVTAPPSSGTYTAGIRFNDLSTGYSSTAGIWGANGTPGTSTTAQSDRIPIVGTIAEGNTAYVEFFAVVVGGVLSCTVGGTYLSGPSMHFGSGTVSLSNVTRITVVQSGAAAAAVANGYVIQGWK